jgi:hypothetical protein
MVSLLLLTSLFFYTAVGTRNPLLSVHHELLFADHDAKNSIISEVSRIVLRDEALLMMIVIL